MVYFELFNEISEFTDAECGQFFRDMLNYGITGETPDYQDRAMRTLWKSVQRRIDADGKRYEEKSQKRAEAGRLGGLAKANNAKQSLAKASNAKQIYPTTTTTPTTTPSSTNSMGTDKPHTPARFVKPTVEEVREYCNGRKNGIDPQRFIDYYEVNGWMQSRGKPIKDWRAAVRTWESNNKGSPAPKAQIIDAGYSSSDLVEYPEGSGQYIRRDAVPGGMDNAV